MQNKEIRLASRPAGVPTDENFQMVETEVPSIADGSVLLRSLYISVDPYLRGRMRESKSYVPPFQLGQVIESGVVSEVVESKSPDFKQGDVVSSYLGLASLQRGDCQAIDANDPRCFAQYVSRCTRNAWPYCVLWSSGYW